MILELVIHGGRRHAGQLEESIVYGHPTVYYIQYVHETRLPLLHQIAHNHMYEYISTHGRRLPPPATRLYVLYHL